MPGANDNDDAPTKDHWFTTTHWSVVLAAGETTSPAAQQALETLCRAYWYPLYAYTRREGYTPHDAQDLTQAFFARLLEKDYLASVQREKGKFRSFLLACLRHFLSDERDRARAQKRGGGQALVSFDEQVAENQYRLEPTDEKSAEKLFDRRWALTVLDQARARLRAEYVRAGKTGFYESLAVLEAGGPDTPSYAEVAAQLRATESAVKSALYRLRQRYRELVREGIAQTVADPAEIDEEIRYLIAVVGG
jgi:RNA polymerase sigma factor (sigma-70 family)